MTQLFRLFLDFCLKLSKKYNPLYIVLWTSIFYFLNPIPAMAQSTCTVLESDTWNDDVGTGTYLYGDANGQLQCVPWNQRASYPPGGACLFGDVDGPFNSDDVFLDGNCNRDAGDLNICLGAAGGGVSYACQFTYVDHSVTFDLDRYPALAGFGSFTFFPRTDCNGNVRCHTGGTITTLHGGLREIDVTSSVSGPVADGGEEIYNDVQQGVPITVTYTVTNRATEILTLGAVAIHGVSSRVAPPQVTGPSSTSIPGGGATTFSVTFTPNLVSAFDDCFINPISYGCDFSFGISLANDDTNETPYDIGVFGNLDESRPIVAVSSSEDGDVPDGTIDSQGNELVGTAKTVTYTVESTGSLSATLGTATAGALTNVSAPTISAPLSNTLAGGSSTTFTVTYTPTAAGPFSFPISFTNNDAAQNPYDITISGTAFTAPEIEVSSSESGAVADGGTDEQATALFTLKDVAGTAKTVTYTVTNTGNDVLTLSTATAFPAGTNVSTPLITAPVSTSLAGGGTATTFTVTYTPISAGPFSLPVLFLNNDSDEGVYNFEISGTATGDPEIEVFKPLLGAIADGGADEQGSFAAGTAKIVTYGVSNTGTDTLNVMGWTAPPAGIECAMLVL